MQWKKWSLIGVLVTCLWIIAGCEYNKQPAITSHTPDTNSSDTLETDTVTEVTGSDDQDNNPPESGCGNGILTDDEACDDGNLDDNDGCAANCRSVEPGYSCNPPGALCQKVARCGDGLQMLPELCDDGNVENGDGCSRTCKVEIGFKCSGSPSECTPTECGDRIIEGAEGCDDGNAIPFDGCNENCQLEPDCTSGNGCTSSCGDGLIIGEACDDGNTLNGDGCSSECTIESGFECTQKELGSSLVVPVVYRDFLESHPDFEINLDVSPKGMVASTLGADGKPVLATPGVAGVTSAATFNEWYNDSANSITVVKTLTLEPAGNNFYYENCAFFPLDNAGWSAPDVMAEIKKNANYPGNCGGYNYENAGLHAFYFTSEVRFWFKYSGNHVLTFIGDDDVWVFVNDKLAVDLGGIHAPETGTVQLNATTADTYGLKEGGVYEISVFQAERHVTGSSYRLTLSGFNTSRSECLPVCGDGVVGLGEECDDGENNGGYGECGEGCLLGEYCGDGIVQKQENCDPADPQDDGNCPNSCRITIID